jgi:hypothetical protein
MAETKRASEMTMEQIEEVLREMDWTEIHKARVFSDYGDDVVLYTDGTFSAQGSSTYYRDPDAAGVISYLKCWGQGNVDRTDYFDGWLAPNEDENVYGDYVTLDVTGTGYDAGRVLTEDEAFTEAIEEGDWDYEEEIEAVLENVREERRYAAEVARDA